MKLSARSILKKSIKIISYDMWRYIAIFVIAESIALLLMRQISGRIFQLALISAKIQGINDQNFWKILASPPALLLIFLTLFLLATFVILQMSLIIGFADRTYHKNTFSFKSIFKPIIKMNPGHFIILLFYIFIIMPLGNLGVTSAITANLRVPSFILDVIYGNLWMSVAYYSSMLILFYLSIRYFYAFIIFYNEDCNFFEAMSRSWAMTRYHIFLIFKLTGLVTLITFIAMFAVIIISMLPLFLVDSFAPQYTRLANSLCSTAFLFLSMLVISMSSIALVQTIVVSFHELKGDGLQIEPHAYRPKRRGFIINLSVLVLYAGFSVLVFFDNPSPELTGDVFIVSHRGESVRAIENTLESLQLANEFKPNYVEMDIQQLRDGTIVVHHDSQLKRLAGISRKLTSYSFEELNRDVVLSSNGHTSRIPSLDEYLDLARSLDQKIMIEIKTNSSDSESFYQDIHDLVEKNNMTDDVIYQSLDKKAILAYKELFPETTVGYILGINVGGLENINVDFFSLEDFSLSTHVMRDAQRMRKGLFVWTVNDESLMRTYFQSDVSGIITDKVELANQVREQLRNNPISDLFWNFGLYFD